jgi:hypothetical protein
MKSIDPNDFKVVSPKTVRIAKQPKIGASDDKRR